MPLNIAVCIKPVPDPDYYDTIQLHPETKTLIREGIPTILNPVDKNAIEAGLQLKEQLGGKVDLFSMAPPTAVEIIRQGLAMGADAAYLLSDRAFAGADTLATSYVLSLGLRKAGQYDLLLLGNESADGSTGQVPAQVGELLGFAHLTNVEEIEVETNMTAQVKTKTENGFIVYEIKLPAVLGVARTLNKPRYTSITGIMAVHKKPITTWGARDLEADPAKIGLMGSPTQPGEIFVPDTNREGEELTGTPEEIVDAIIKHLRAAGITLVEGRNAS